jgi:predicted PurR-regulated permease PerM
MNRTIPPVPPAAAATYREMDGQPLSLLTIVTWIVTTLRYVRLCSNVVVVVVVVVVAVIVAVHYYRVGTMMTKTTSNLPTSDPRQHLEQDPHQQHLQRQGDDCHLRVIPKTTTTITTQL